MKKDDKRRKSNWSKVPVPNQNTNLHEYIKLDSPSSKKLKAEMFQTILVIVTVSEHRYSVGLKNAKKLRDSH